ncbi:hypothetical protein TNCT_449301 [Trichonephila clavata]|uniref:Uncharacterized protein n=1 Tax=Trichonephila clavata TaxID=2740835 RepID=A0A8X6HR32_TRICU|nr:hypothetical protein TNCT_449301 [Trichonephila clavata]
MLPREQKIRKSCFDLNFEKSSGKKQSEYSANQVQDNSLDKNITAQTVFCAKENKDKGLILPGKGLEFKLGDEILGNEIALSNSTSGSRTHLSGAESLESAVAETFKNKNKSPKSQHYFVSGNKSGPTSPCDTRSKQSNIGTKLAGKHKWWNKNQSSDDTNKQEWIVNFPAPRPTRYEPPVKQNRLSCLHPIKYRLFKSRPLGRDSQHCMLRNSKQEAKLESSKYLSPVSSSTDKTLQNLEDIDEDYRRLNEQCRSMVLNIQQQATRTRNWRGRMRGLFHDIRERMRQVFSRSRD